MKRIKKMLSVMLAVAMTLAMSVTAFATGTETPAAPTVTHTYKIFQIFTGDFSGTVSNPVLSNVKWGQNAQGGKTGDDVAETILNEIEALKDKSENEKAAALAKYADLTDTNAFATVTGTNDNDITVEVDKPGYYLIKDQDGSQTSANGNYALYMVKVINNKLTFKPKVGVPTVDKVIKVSGNDKKDSNGAIGDVVNYEFTGTMPDNFDMYNTYLYKFTDTLSKGLEYNKNSLSVNIVNGTDKVDVTDYFYKNVSEYNEVTGTTIVVGMKDIKVLTFTDDTHRPIATIDKNTKVVVTYSATIRDNAVVGNPGNPNKVDLEYSNNPNDSGNGTTPPPETPDNPTSEKPTGKTPESVVVTYTTELAIIKTMEGDNVLPTGVEFTLEGTNLNRVKVEKGEQFVEVTDGTGTYYKLKDGTYTTKEPIKETTAEVKANIEYYESDTPTYKKVEKSSVTTEKVTNNKVTAYVGEDGKLTFVGLCAGDYVLKETVTPDGYNKINDITIKISYENGNFTVKWEQINENNEKVEGTGSTGEVIVADGDNTFSSAILNKTGSLLPSTGGIGTTIFYIVGAILVVGAAILLVTKKRMSKEA